MMRRVNDGLDRFARDFAAGTVLFEEGQPGDFMYVVHDAARSRSGARSARPSACSRCCRPGEFFGEMAILNGGRARRPRSCARLRACS